MNSDENISESSGEEGQKYLKAKQAKNSKNYRSKFVNTDEKSISVRSEINEISNDFIPEISATSISVIKSVKKTQNDSYVSPMVISDDDDYDCSGNSYTFK